VKLLEREEGQVATFTNFLLEAADAAAGHLYSLEDVMAEADHIIAAKSGPVEHPASPATESEESSSACI